MTPLEVICLVVWAGFLFYLFFHAIKNGHGDLSNSLRGMFSNVGSKAASGPSEIVYG